MSHEFFIPLTMSSEPCPPFFQQWNLAVPRLVSPVQKTWWLGSRPCASAASATIILKVEPGAYWPAMVLLVKGFSGFSIKDCHSAAVRPAANLLGSKPGVEA